MARPARILLAVELLLGAAYFLLPAEHLDKLGAAALNRSGFPVVEVPLADAVPLRPRGAPAYPDRVRE
jgi:hypothetical protein